MPNDRVTSPWKDPEEFFWQMCGIVKKYKECQGYSKKYPEKMNHEKWRKLEWMLKDATWHEYLWDRFYFQVNNPRKEKPVAKSKKKFEDCDVGLEPLLQRSLF